MLERFSGPIPPQENKEKLAVKSIPEDLTKGILSINYVKNGIAIGRGLDGKLDNGPIEVGKPIKTLEHKTTEVIEIKRINNVYYIKTKSGSEYRFDPSESVKKSDNF